jgi:preprotein translocase subunit SecG
MQTVLSIVHIGVSFFMILVILLQAGKSGGMGGLSGGASSAFGARGTQTLLGKLTSYCAAIFMLTSLGLSYLSSRNESLMKSLPPKAAEAAPATAAPTEAAPAAPAPTEAAPAPVEAGEQK